MRGLLSLVVLLAALCVVLSAPQREQGELPRSPLGSLLAQIQGLRENVRDAHGQVLQSVLLPFGRLDRKRPNPSKNQTDNAGLNNEAVPEEKEKKVEGSRHRPGRRPTRPVKNEPDQQAVEEAVTQQPDAPRRKPKPTKNKENGQVADSSLDIPEVEQQEKRKPSRQRPNRKPSDITNKPSDEEVTTKPSKRPHKGSTTPMTTVQVTTEIKANLRSQDTKVSPKGGKAPSPLTPPTAPGLHPPPAHGTTEDWSDVHPASDDQDDEFHVTRRIIDAPCLGGTARDGSCRESFD